jgi:hypothetical protein
VGETCETAREAQWERHARRRGRHSGRDLRDGEGGTVGETCETARETQWESLREGEGGGHLSRHPQPHGVPVGRHTLS